MAWFSLLPAYLSAYEAWAVRIFLLFGILTIGPWVLLLTYDLLLYLWRTAVYEVPVIGGRARGKRRPRAPSLRERPSGAPRRFSMGAVSAPHHKPNIAVED